MKKKAMMEVHIKQQGRKAYHKREKDDVCVDD
jgi:hypothetical protein